MSLLKWLKKIFEIKPVEKKSSLARIEQPELSKEQLPGVDQQDQPALNILKEGCVVVSPQTTHLAEETPFVEPDQEAPAVSKPKRKRKPRKPKDYNG